MKYGVLGTGSVAQTIASKLIELGHHVMMTNPNELSEPVTGFYCGNDTIAKDAIREILHDFGWTDTFDMGDISMSRYTEMLGAFWVPVFGQLNTMHWGFRLVR